MCSIEKGQRHALEQIAEVKRVLGATVHAMKSPGPATLLITSAAPGEGKSLFAAVLAVAAANSGRYRVAALDLNWHRPALHRFFDLTLNHSTKEIVAAELSELVCPSGLDALAVLTAPQDYSDHDRLNARVFSVANRLIEQAKATYDLVIVDSAAIFPTNRMMMDPVMLSGLTDGVVMVVLIGATPRQQVRKAQKIMETAGANVLGVIANQRTVSASR
jgi:protein-tyrosine kinase